MSHLPRLAACAALIVCAMPLATSAFAAGPMNSGPAQGPTPAASSRSLPSGSVGPSTSISNMPGISNLPLPPWYRPATPIYVPGGRSPSLPSSAGLSNVTTPGVQVSPGNVKMPGVSIGPGKVTTSTTSVGPGKVTTSVGPGGLTTPSTILMPDGTQVPRRPGMTRNQHIAIDAEEDIFLMFGEQ